MKYIHVVQRIHFHDFGDPLNFPPGHNLELSNTDVYDSKYLQN